jgi:hypothetical protein
MVLTIIKRPHALATTTTTSTATTTTAIPSATSSPKSLTTSTGINTQDLNSNDYSTEQFSVELSPGFTIHSVCAFERNDDDDKHIIELFTTAWKSDVVASGAVKDSGLLGCWEGTAPVFENIPVTLL